MSVPRELRDFLPSGDRDSAPSVLARSRRRRRAEEPPAEETPRRRPKPSRRQPSESTRQRLQQRTEEVVPDPQPTQPPSRKPRSRPRAEDAPAEATAARPPARQRTEPTQAPAAMELVTVGLESGVPLPRLRGASGKLEASRLQPDEEWPVRVEGRPSPDRLEIGSIEFPTYLDGEDFHCAVQVVIARSGWTPPHSGRGWHQTPHPRSLLVTSTSGEHLGMIQASAGQEELFWLLFQLDACVNEEKRVVELGELAHYARGALTVKLRLNSRNVFTFDREIAENVSRKQTADLLRGDVLTRSHFSGTAGIRALRRLVGTLASGPHHGFRTIRSLRRGVDAHDATLNGFLLGAEPFIDEDDPNGEEFVERRLREVLPSESDRDAREHAVSTLLAMAAVDDDGMALPSAAVLASLKSTPMPFQTKGVEWMMRRETAPDALTLHPAWSQFVTADGEYLYAHRFAGAFSRHFFSAPTATTCGGLLCDDVGLGKSLQVLTLVLAKPPPDGWAVDELPVETDSSVPIKCTLIVCPAAILVQWEDEIEKHVKPGALKYCIYLGLGNKRSSVASGGSAPVADADAAPGIAHRRTRRRRTQAQRFVPSHSAASRYAEEQAAPAEEGDEDEDNQRQVHEVLARQTHLFAGPRGAAPPPLAQCDIVLCSFEVLRDELRKTDFDAVEGNEHARLASPLGALGFYRIILDEAQLVSQTTSRAALMCSSLSRRHAWVCTATPVNRDVSELHGLLAFLGVDPIADRFVFDHLYLDPFKRRESGARARLVSLLSGLMLRRSRQAPGVAAQIALPPVRWETTQLQASPAERAAYRVQWDATKRSHAAYVRNHNASLRGSGHHQAGSRLLGALNGDLTRLRQTVCHPAVVNEARERAAGATRVVAASGQALPMSAVLRRIVARAHREALAAAVSLLRARAIALIVSVNYPGDDDDDDDQQDVITGLESIMAELEHLRAKSTTVAIDPDDDDGDDDKRRGEDTTERLAGELAAFQERYPDAVFVQPDGDADPVTTDPHELTLADVEEKEEDGNVVDDRMLRARARFARARALYESQAWTKRGGRLEARGGRLEARIQRLVLRVGDEKVKHEAVKAISALSAQYRDKDSTRNYLLRELREAETLAEKSHETTDKEPQSQDAASADEQRTCTICLDTVPMDVRWSMAPCGHGACQECMETWVRLNRSCPICKRTVSIDMLLTIKSASEEEPVPRDATQGLPTAANNPSAAANQGDWGTKLGAVLSEVGAAIASQQKIVVFSAWTRLLKLAASACAAHSIDCASLIGSPAAKQAALAHFALDASSGGAPVLLVPLFGGASGAGGGGAAGLTLTHASTALLLEPALQPGIEQQAAGRISRIGQTKPARVVRLIVEDTIEAKIVQWQERRMNDGASKKGAALGLNDFVHLGLGDDPTPE